ncbi:hypothetical protein FA15DRAFT_701849 [Coprinopsis marcescibilis]|uniref:Uncharacterized protein n=1 Tax=Coprinopsis marcescibilis TaxID=230819 RepID=A0A5C3LG02_COPMA|nr:hypothetical protein FA15DRAFT_701849 [Coprinopsis marcescibilis]
MLGLQTPNGTNGLAITEQHPSDDRYLFAKLLEMNKTLKRRLLGATPEEIVSVSVQIGKGIATARSTDAKGKLLCPVDYDWEDPNVRADLASNRVNPFESDEDGMYP